MHNSIKLNGTCKPCTRLKIRGNRNTFAGNNNEFYGDDLCVTGDRNTIVGNHCIVVGEQNYIRGNRNTVNGDGCVVIGDWCSVTGDRCMVVGKQCVVNGNNCHVEGQKNEVIGDCVVIDPSQPPDTPIVDTETENEELRCVICFVNRRCFRNSPCGHMVTCSACTKVLWDAGNDVRCPVCRANVFKTDYVSW